MIDRVIQFVLLNVYSAVYGRSYAHFMYGEPAEVSEQERNLSDEEN